MKTGYLKKGVLIGFGAMAIGTAYAQIPNAPPAPTCAMEGGQSNCQFKTSMSGTPTSVVGNRVILFRRSANGGHGTSRTYSEDALKRLATRYGFTATITEDPAIFTVANLQNTKVVIMSNGDGDVIPAGANRTALENFQQVNGWGVIWIHAACAFITSGWPFGQNSCVQQYFHHNPSGTNRRVFIDSGTTAAPNHGIKNPQSEFLLRSLPGWDQNRTISMGDEYYCFRAPARNTAGTNVLIGFDRSSGAPNASCPEANLTNTAGSQNHNLAWMRNMGQGISIYNSIGHDVGTYTGNQNAGDSLLWRFIRYAAKDWEVKQPVSVISNAKQTLDQSASAGPMEIKFNHSGRNDIVVTDIKGNKVFAKSYSGVNRAEVQNLKRGIYFVRVNSGKHSELQKVRLF